MRCLSYRGKQNSIFCNGCIIWVHKKGSGLQRPTPKPAYMCALCRGNVRPIDGRPQSEVQVGPDNLEMVTAFCYLGDMLSAGRSCTETSSHYLCENRLEEVHGSTTSSLTPTALRQNLWPCVQLSCAERHAPISETLPLKKTNLQRLLCNDRAIINQARGCGHSKVKQDTGKA